MATDEKVAADIRQVADKLGTRELSRAEYLRHGQFPFRQLYDGGRTWQQLCRLAGVKTKTTEHVPDEVYFERLRKAVEHLGRLPKSSERKKFGLNFSQDRYPSLELFLQKAVEQGVIEDTRVRSQASPAQTVSPSDATRDAAPPPHPADTPATFQEVMRPAPPIPLGTRRKKWERTGLDGFPYAPHDELGVIAVFAMLCLQRRLDWQIIELSGGRGIDAVCFDHGTNKQLRVEFKHTLSKASWNHKIEDLDCVVCWRNAWKDFPKPVIELCELLRRF